MDDKELYQQKKQAQLDEWTAEIEKLKAKAEGANADTQLEIKQQIEKMQSRLEEGKSKLAEMSEAGQDAWESLKGGLDSAWESIASAFSEATDKFKK